MRIGNGNGPVRRRIPWVDPLRSMSKASTSFGFAGNWLRNKVLREDLAKREIPASVPSRHTILQEKSRENRLGAKLLRELDVPASFAI